MEEQSRQLRVLVLIACILCAVIVAYNAFYVPEASLSSPVTVADSCVSGATSGEAAAYSGKLNLNSATVQELSENLPGVGETIAARIVAYREENGGFSSVEELLNVEGIGEKKYEQIKDLLTLS